jgi:hypothetical protein
MRLGDWSAAYKGADGQPISSPALRAVESGVSFGEQPVSSTAVTLAYLPRNREITEIKAVPRADRTNRP